MVAATTPKIYCLSCETNFAPIDPHVKDLTGDLDDTNSVTYCQGCALRAEIRQMIDELREDVTNRAAQILALDGQKASGNVIKLLTWLAERPYV